MEQGNTFSSGKDTAGDTWYVDNYVLLKDYYDRTISRIAARCVRRGNIAMEEYPHYAYILDVLEEISETGEYIVEHTNLYPYVEKKIAGGIAALKKSLREFNTELQNNASPDMIKQDKDELAKIKEALGDLDKSKDPTAGAGMSMDQVVEKLMRNQQQSNAQAAAQQQQARPIQPQQQRPAQQQVRPAAPQQHPGMQQMRQAQRPMQPQGGQPAPQQQNPAGQQQPRPAQPQVNQNTPNNPGQAPRSPFVSSEDN